MILQPPTKKVKTKRRQRVLVVIPTLQELAMNCILNDSILSQTRHILWRVLYKKHNIYRDLQKRMDDNIKCYDAMIRMWREQCTVVQGLPDTTFCYACDTDVDVDYGQDVHPTHFQNALVLDYDHWRKMKTILRTLRTNTKELQRLFGSSFSGTSKIK